MFFNAFVNYQLTLKHVSYISHNRFFNYEGGYYNAPSICSFCQILELTGAPPVKKFAHVYRVFFHSRRPHRVGGKGGSAVVEDCGGEAQVNGRFPEQLRAKTESQRFSEILSHHFNKVPPEAGSKQKATNKRGCCCKAFIEGKRKEDTTQQSTAASAPSPLHSLGTTGGCGQIRGFNGLRPESWRPALSCG